MGTDRLIAEQMDEAWARRTADDLSAVVEKAGQEMSEDKPEAVAAGSDPTRISLKNRLVVPYSTANRRPAPSSPSIRRNNVAGAR